MYMYHSTYMKVRGRLVSDDSHYIMKVSETELRSSGLLLDNLPYLTNQYPVLF